MLEGDNPARREASKLALEKEQAEFRQALHKATHDLARTFLEVDATFKQYRTAQGLQASARQRLESQRAFYDEGRVTVDRLLDAVGQHANATAQESLHRSTYNTTIACLEEAKGTLLAHDRIDVVEGPRPRKLDGVVPASFETPAEKPQPAPTWYRIKASLGGLRILDVEVEVGPAPKGR